MIQMPEITRILQKQSPEQLYQALSPAERQYLPYLWELWARPSQMPPSGNWITWLFLAGRGAGKTRSSAEFVRDRVTSGKSKRVALLGRTPSDARDVMVEGESGILAVFPMHEKPEYEPSKRRITFHNGAVATTFSSETPEQLRGPQFDLAWVDELAAFDSDEAYLNLQLALRLGQDPRQVISTTPRPVPVLRELIANPNTIITRGTTYDNVANLAPQFVREITQRFEGTPRGRQELYGEMLVDSDNPFGKDTIERQTQDVLSDELPLWYGVDLARVVDYSVVVGLDANGRVAFFDRFQSSWASTEDRICLAVADDDCLVDATGVGDSTVERLQDRLSRVEPFVFTSRSRQLLLEGLAASLSHGEVTVLRGAMLEELQAFSTGYNKQTRSIRYQVPEGVHDDTVMALALADECRRQNPASRVPFASVS